MLVSSGSTTYEAGKLVAQTATTRIYLCKETGSERRALLRIASEIAHNGGLDREAYVLRELKRLADSTEAAFQTARPEATNRLGYDLLFPELVDSFVCLEQGKRRINVLAFRQVDDVSSMVPLSGMITKDRLRVDLRTSAWIMGRLLKLLGFVHGEGIAVRQLEPSNLVLQPKRHFAVTFNWSSARIHNAAVPRDERANDIAQAAQTVITALGGQLASGHIPDVSEETQQYADYLLRLARHGESNASRGHQRFYEIVDGLWPREYYPFTTKPLVG